MSSIREQVVQPTFDIEQARLVTLSQKAVLLDQVRMQRCFVVNAFSAATYMDFGGLVCSAVRGVPFGRSGSIIKVTAYLDMGLLTTPGALTFEAHINAAAAFSVVVAVGASGTQYSGSAEQDAGIDTFTETDILSGRITFGGGLAGTVSRAYLTVDLQFDE